MDRKPSCEGRVLALTITATQPVSAVADEHLVFADAALALAGHEVTDPVLRAIIESAARHELTGDEVIAAIRSHVQADDSRCHLSYLG